MSDPGSLDTPRKFSSKRRHLTCSDCEIPLPDGYGSSTCRSCRGARHRAVESVQPPTESLPEEPSAREMMLWVKEFVQDSMAQMRQSLSATRGEPSGTKRRRTTLDSDVPDSLSLCASDSSLESEDEEEEKRCQFPAEKIGKLLRLVRAKDQPQEQPAVKHFIAQQSLKATRDACWKQPDRTAVTSSRFFAMFPLAPEEASWTELPKVDLAIAKLSSRTVLPTSDGASLKDPSDRKLDSTLRKAYLASAAQSRVAIASSEVAGSLKKDLVRFQEELDAGRSRDELLQDFKTLLLQVEFLQDASAHQSRLAACGLGFSTVGRRAVWLRPWSADAASKNFLCNLPFESGRLFGSELDTLMEGLSDRKGKSLPVAPRGSRTGRYKSKSPPRTLRPRASARRGRGRGRGSGTARKEPRDKKKEF